MARRCVIAACALAAVLACIAGTPVVATPLDDYVAQADPEFTYTDLGVKLNGTGWTGHVYNMTSQRWLDDTLVSRSLWWHMMVVIVPTNISVFDTGLLWITGSGNRGTEIKFDDSDVQIAAGFCMRNGVVGAALYQVPNQPLTVYSDPWHKENRVEDSAIAITWWKFAQDPSKPEWILELPMTKAGVRALDLISAVAPKYNGGYNVTRFIVAGASKRGWTTWLVGAVDTRVIAIVPIVLDALHVHRFIHRQITYYGEFTFALQDYVHANITSYLDTPVFTQLMQIVDPYFYLHRLTMPKLAINAVGDEFQMPDDQRHWAHDAPGMMQTLMVKNAEHSLATGMFEVLDAATAFVSGILAAESSTRRAVQPFARAEQHTMPRLERYRQSVSDLRRASGLPVVAADDLTPAARPSAASARLLQERARAVSSWYQMPTVEWEIDNVNGAIHVYTSEPPAIVDIAWTDSPTGVSAGKRDFRWAAVNTSWCPVKVFGACVRPVIWLTTKQNVTKVTDTHYMGQVDLPPTGLWRAFIVEVKFANPNLPSAEYWFATPASVVPNTAPFPDCYGLECTDRMC